MHYTSGYLSISYLREPFREETVTVDLNQLSVCIPDETCVNTQYYVITLPAYLGDSLMHSFCARALHRDVLPVPGGPIMDMDSQSQYI